MNKTEIPSVTKASNQQDSEHQASGRKEPVNNLNKQDFVITLPTKIAGVVFWGMVLIGLAMSVGLIKSKEQELILSRDGTIASVSQEIASYLSNNQTGFDQHSEQQLAGLLEQLQRQSAIQAIEVEQAGERLMVGETQSQFDTVAQELSLTGVEQPVRVIMYFESLEQSVQKMRKNIILALGLLIFLFGMILQKILQHMLSKPFLHMVNSAIEFTAGNRDVRFDESKADEFGFLSKFINRALESMLDNQQQLNRMLDLVVKSEAELAREKEQAEVTLHAITDGVITTDPDSRVIYLNPAAETLTGWKNEAARGRPLEEVFHLVDEKTGEHLPDPAQLCLQNLSDERVKSHAALNRTEHADSLSVEVSAAAMHNQDSEVIGVVVVFQDVSHARHLTRQLSFQASHDELTGLYNRRRFEQHVAELIEQTRSSEQHHVLLYMDLDQFKIVNDTCGHMAGDELLRQLSIELMDCLRDNDLLARLGGDEFGAILDSCPLAKGEEIAEKLRQRVKDFRFVWDDKSFEIGVSIGLVGIDASSDKLADVLSSADMACYAAKDSGRNRIHIYEPSDEALTERHSEMHCAMRISEALEEDKFYLARQPIMPLSEQAISAQTEHWEILVRMENIQGEIIEPGAFLPAAERYNLMHKLDRYVIRSLFIAIANQCWQSSDRKQLFTVNLSGGSLNDDELLAGIIQDSETYQVDLNTICFEITETVAISNLSKAKEFMQQLKAKGCRFALDDFGSGLSSFGYLKTLPVDYIKIDGSFVQDITHDPISRAMVESINQIGHIMGKQTIAEFVENDETLQILKQIGVDYSQGFYTGEPVIIDGLRECIIAAKKSVA